MRRLLFDCRVVSERIDGLGRYALGLAGSLARSPRGYEITFIVPPSLSADHPLRTISSIPGARAISSDIPMMRVSSHLRMASVYRAHASDLYHYPHFNLPITAPAPAVVTIHDATPFVYPQFFGRQRRLKRAYFWLSTAFSIARSAAIIVPSRASADALLERFAIRRGRLHVVPEGVDPVFSLGVNDADLAATRARYGITGPFLLYVGTSRPHKNLMSLFRAFARIAPDVPHELLIAGQPIGEVRELDALVRKLGIAPRIRRLGYLPDLEVRRLYRLADAAVTCSLFEGFGLGVLEAMASGTPVVASAASAAGEVAGDAAVTVDPTSVDDIAAGLRRVCTDATLRASLRDRGSVRAALFTWARAGEMTLDVYDAVLSALA